MHLRSKVGITFLISTGHLRSREKKVNASPYTMPTKALLPELFGKKSSLNEEKRTEAEENIVPKEDADSNRMVGQGDGTVSKVRK